jgi:hypothetical protein
MACLDVERAYALTGLGLSEIKKQIMPRDIYIAHVEIRLGSLGSLDSEKRSNLGEQLEAPDPFSGSNASKKVL